ncbi:sigma-54 interaction domain-containing protein [Vibrio sp.]|uniref:sigma-54 interaction domain-containing protein n=1 Tax=Vibrio sp. TaxID=678 RepID=UPI003D09E5A5
MSYRCQQAKVETLFPDDFYPLIGDSGCIEELKTRLQKYAQCDAEVLIQGETGVGKGLCARQIHQMSSRRARPFIEVNCGAIPSGLIASELFGHEKGAFTGAITDHIGFIQRADGGTLFLDEIGDMPPDLQIHLLHFLENKVIQKLGGEHSIAIDCRVIAASHVELKQEVMQGKFREDLYYRLNILPLTVPPLRKRNADVILLANFFLDKMAKDGQKGRLSKYAKQALLKHAWPGNVRELRNVIQRALVMCDNNLLHQSDLGLETVDRQLLPASDQIDLDYLLQAIENNNHNMSAAARQLGISRTTLYRLIKKYNLQL